MKTKKDALLNEAKMDATAHIEPKPRVAEKIVSLALDIWLNRRKIAILSENKLLGQISGF